MKNSNQKKGYLWKSMISYIIVFAMALSVCPPLYVEASQWTSSGYNGCAGLEVLEKALENDQAPIFMIKDGKIMPYSAVYSANVGDTVALTYGMRDYNLFGASGTTDVGRYRYAMMGSYMRLPTSAWWLDTARNAGDLQYTGSNAKSVDQLKIEIPGRGTKKVHEWFGMTADDFIEFNEMFFTMSHYRGGWPVNEVKVYEADVDGNDGYAAGEKPSKNSPEVVDDNMGTIYTGNAIEWRNGYRNAIYGYNSTRSGKFAGERIWEAIKRSGVAASKESWSVWSKGHNVAPSPLPTNEAGVQPTPSGNVATNYGHWDDVKALVDTPEFRWVVYPYLWLIAKTNGNSWNDANGKFVSNRIVGVKEIEITSDMLGVNNSLNDNGPLITGELVKKQSGSTWKDKEWQMVGTKLRVLPEVEPGEVPDTKEIDDNIYGTLEIGKVGQKFEGVKWGSSLTLEIATNAMSAGTLTHLAYKIVGGPGDVAAMVDQNTAQTMKLEANANPTQNPWTTPGPTTPPSSEVPSKDAHTIVLDKDTLTSQLYFEKPGTYKLRVEVFTNIPEQFWNVGQPFPYNGEYEALEKPRSLGFTTFEVVVGKGSIQLVKDNEEVTYTNLNAVDTYADKLDYNGKDQDCTLYKTLPKFKHSDITNGRWYPIAADDNQLFERKKVGTVKNVGDELEGEIGGGSIFTNPWSDYLTILPEGAKYSFTVAPLEIAGTWMRRVMGVPQYSTWKNADYDVDFPVYKNANYTIDTALSFDTSAFDGIQPAPQITYQKAIWDKEVQDNFTTLLNNAIADLQAKFAILEGLLAQTNPPATSAAIASAQAAYNQAEVVVAELGEAQKQGFFIPIGSGESNYSRYEQKDVKMYNGEIDRTLVTVRAISSNPNIVFTDYNIFGVTINPYAVSADFYTYLDANYPIGQTSWNPPPVPLSELDDVKIIPSSLVDTYKVEFTVTRTEGTTGDYLLDNLKILNSSNEQDFNYRCNVPGPVSASDKNGNGMPDWWEFEVNDDEFLSQYGDEDNDGIPNFVEFLFTFADVEFAIEYAAKYGYNCNPELDGHHFPLKKVYGVSNTVPANMSQFKGTNPCNADTDGDGYDDYYEYFFGLRENYDTTARFNAHNAKFNPTIAGLNSYNTQNLDDSGLTLKQNHILWLRGLAINPVKPSTADDSYTDGWKILVSGLAQDEDFAITDSKLASDDFDITSLAFNPTHSCSNGTATAANGMMSPLAKFTWWKEKGTSLTKANILNPLVASTADDGIYDGWKVFWEFNPLSAISATQISHTGSGMTDRAKFDWWKLKGYPLTEGRVLNPKAADTDGDGWNDDVEIAAGTDPLNAQSFPNIVPP
ncbi:MAG: thrombospondin type 3 repeat-containing protein, partial [Oscillospiraceae bacterium]|nr:thrombospondin type 3 repeat-containing protein [Oscillospiraceae bacterium]